MASRAEVVSFIKSTYNNVKDDDGLLFLLFDQGDNRSQGVFVSVDDAKMQVSSAFATTDSIKAEQAFQATEKTDTAFGIGRIGTYYVVKHVVPIADMDPSEIHVGIEITAKVADELEVALGLSDNF